MIHALSTPAFPTFSGRLISDPSAMAPFLTDWRRRWTGDAIAVAQPESAEDVAIVLRWCNEHGIAVVPQGGNTGLSGGAVPEPNARALVLSLTRMARIRNVDPVNNTIIADAGCTLTQVQEAAREANRLFPLSLAAEGTCTIGGNLATNAGGVQVLRYGNVRELCLGLEVVTSNGEIWNGLRGLRKDNTGYDLRDLFIGSEGTLGVITGAVLKLSPIPAAQTVAFLSVPSPAAAVRLLEVAQRRVGSSLTAFELLTDTCLDLVLRHMPGTRRPVESASPWYVLLELSDAVSQEHAAEAIEALFELAFEEELTTDAVVSSSLSQFESLWALRENISEAQAAEGKTIKHDISLPISEIPRFLNHTDQLIRKQYPQVRLVVFGHLGDGNLHYNLSPSYSSLTDSDGGASFLFLEKELNRLVHDEVVCRGGSISAEHGLGVLRRDESMRYKSSVELKLMQALKKALDPKGLMNPAKVLA